MLFYFVLIYSPIFFPQDSKKSLFNPDNPDIPIMVRPNLRDKKIKSKLVKSDSVGIV